MIDIDAQRIATTPQRLFSRSGVRFEVACDVIGAVVAHFAEAIGRERDRPTHDSQKIAHAQQLVAELKDIREDLDPKDSAAIEATIERLRKATRRPAGPRNSPRRTLPLPSKVCRLQSTIWPFRHRSSGARSAPTRPWLGISAAPCHERHRHHVPSRARGREPDAG
jgi:hypothetical protein